MPPDASTPPSITPPSITLCVCTYNRGDALTQTLDTLDAAAKAHNTNDRPTNDHPAEILIVNNNSTDNTADVAARFAAAATTPTRVVTETEQGLGAARARGLAETTAPLLALVDDDVLVDPNYVTNTLSRLQTSDNIGAVGGRVELKWLAGPTPFAKLMADTLAQQDMGPEAHETSHTLVGAALTFRTEALRKSGWPENAILTDRVGDSTASGGDNEICIRIRQAGYQLWYDSAVRCKHLIPESRQTRDYLTKLAYGTGRSAARVNWLKDHTPGPDWIAKKQRRARRRAIEALCFEWRPLHRARKLARNKGLLEAWAELAESHDNLRAKANAR